MINRLSVPALSTEDFSTISGATFPIHHSGTTSQYSVRCLPGFSAFIGGGEWNPRSRVLFVRATLAFNLPATVKPSSYVIIADSNALQSGGKVSCLGIRSMRKSWAGQDRGPFKPSSRCFVRDRNFAGAYINTIGSDSMNTTCNRLRAVRFLRFETCSESAADCADMSAWGGGAQMGPLDQEIIELDQQSNVLWSWRTRDPHRLVESGAAGFFPAFGNDIIHMNAVERTARWRAIFARH